MSRGREQAAADFAARHRVYLVLKGPAVIAAPDGRRMVNPTGNCGMAKGGSGDVLSGMLVSLLGPEPCADGRLLRAVVPLDGPGTAPGTWSAGHDPVGPAGPHSCRSAGRVTE
ncbi:MAG: NAD(P)H-hydrate dehydratase [Dysosmobacter sp.]